MQIVFSAQITSELKLQISATITTCKNYIKELPDKTGNEITFELRVPTKTQPNSVTENKSKTKPQQVQYHLHFKQEKPRVYTYIVCIKDVKQNGRSEKNAIEQDGECYQTYRTKHKKLTYITCNKSEILTCASIYHSNGQLGGNNS